MDSSYTSSTTKPIYRGTQIVWGILSVLEVLLAFRFVLKLLAANPAAGFSQFIYGITYVFAAPFLNVFRITYVEGSIFDGCLEGTAPVRHRSRSGYVERICVSPARAR